MALMAPIQNGRPTQANAFIANRLGVTSVPTPTATIARPVTPIVYHPPTLYSPPVSSPVVSVSTALPQPVRIGPAPAVPPVSPISSQPIQTSILMPNSTPGHVAPQPNGYMEPLPYQFTGVEATVPVTPSPVTLAPVTEFGFTQNFWLGLLLVAAVILVLASE